MIILTFLLFFSLVQGFERRLNYTSNPNCESQNVSISYIKAEGPNDTLHYLWDFTRTPSFFLAVTDVNTSLNLFCDVFANGTVHSFNFTKTPHYEFSLVLSKLIEFNDVNDTGILRSQSQKIFYNTKDFKWTVLDPLKGDKKGKWAGLSVTGQNYNDSVNTLFGNLTIQLTAFGFENHDVELPRLLHSPNSTQFKIVFDNLKSNSGFTDSRFALEMILVSSESRNSSSKIVLRKNLDDENSPGVFSMVDIITPGALNQRFRGAFLQWRPIIYVSKIPSIANSSEIVAYNLTNVVEPDDCLLNSLPFIYYGSDLDQYLIEQTVVSLGMTEDGFYKKTNFSSWTFLLSYGSPENEKFSLLVVLVMCIGLGLPALLILVGGAYVCAKKFRRNKDELSLER